jgi:biopolymer transport protein ExbB/TolQ
MAPSPTNPTRDRLAGPARQSFVTLAAFLFGVPAAAGILVLVQNGPLADTTLHRYLSHPVEGVELLLFCCALGALLAKVCRGVAERIAFRGALLPPWDGEPVPPAEAGPLLKNLRRLGRRRQRSSLGRRVAAVLDFVEGRRSAADLDDHMRTLADNDAMALEGSYALVRFITWAIPILGFLGTVLGITASIAGVTPDVLEKNLSQVTDGLALAFDATAVALALTMGTMFLTFLTERFEEGVLHAVDQFVDEHLAHRFERSGSEAGELGAALRQQTQGLLRVSEQLVQRQAELWSQTLAEAQQRWAAAGQLQQEAVTAALEQALERTLESHALRLAALEEQTTRHGAALLDRLAALAGAVQQGARDQQAALAELARGVAAQTEALARLDGEGAHLLRLQETLAQNLTLLAGAGAFDQAVSSLTAAIHLLTARVAPGSAPGGPARPSPRTAA